jgi:peptidoglycan/LPS O-acetylase OafA/YrhL
MEKPKNVVLAVRLLFGTMALGAVDLAVTGFPETDIPYGFAIQIGSFLFSIALMSFFYYKINKGRNWARITFAVLFVLGLPSMAFVLPQLMKNPIRGVFIGIQSILQIAALYLIFSKPGSSWFQKPAPGGDKSS